MPSVQVGSLKIECEPEANLRRVLMKAGVRLYHPLVRFGHCRGLGTCGTCAVRIEGQVSEMTGIERWRLGFPPHSHQNDLRLACQCRVQGDLTIEKFPGVWGQQLEKGSITDD